MERGDWDAVARMVQGWANSKPIQQPVEFHAVGFGGFVQHALDISGGIAGTPTAAAALPVAPVGLAASPAPAAAPRMMAPATVNVTVHAGMIADAATLARALTRGERSAARLLGHRWREVAAA